MPLDLSALDGAPRLLMEAQLRPVQGTRFQPTGFPNLGHAVYEAPSQDGPVRMVLVESAQSMANRLETVCWDEVADDWVTPLRGLPLVKVTDAAGNALTNSVLDSHRLNSAYILDSASDSGEENAFANLIDTRLGKFADRPVNQREVFRFILEHCPNSALHGVFFANKRHNDKLAKGRLRHARLLSSFMEAIEAVDVVSGGGKIDRVKAAKDDHSNAETGYGNVPFARSEFTATRIVAYFNLDLRQIRAYGLGAEVETLLVALSLYKIRRFLRDGLRLRTACDLDLVDLSVTRPEGFVPPELDDLEATLPSLIEPLIAAGTLGKTATVKYAPKATGKGKKEATATEGEEETSTEGDGEN